jgi:hypothetical protein
VIRQIPARKFKKAAIYFDLMNLSAMKVVINGDKMPEIEDKEKIIPICCPLRPT